MGGVGAQGDKGLTGMRAGIAVAGWLCLCCAGAAQAQDMPDVRAVPQKPHHCGVASAETILRAYGVTEGWADQTALAACLCARLPDFKTRHPAAADAKERYYPDFEETYQPELAELLIDRGFCVISTRTSLDSETKRPEEFVLRLLGEHLQKGHMAVLHVPGHYVVGIAVDQEAKELHFVDPWRPDEEFHCPWSRFANGESFHTRRDGKDRPGWDGRALIFWPGEGVNLPDRCPVCGKTPPDQRRYCPTCRAWTDRRKSRGVQRVLDAVAECRVGPAITDVNRLRLRRTLRRLVEEGVATDAEVHTALCRYPLTGDDPERLMTLHRYAADRPEVDLERLSPDDQIKLVTTREDWQNRLNDLLSKPIPTGD